MCERNGSTKDGTSGSVNDNTNGSEIGRESDNNNTLTQSGSSNLCVRVTVPTGDDMHAAGRAFAQLLRSQDVVLLSGPLGAGKTTFAQGIGVGLSMDRPVVSPTFTIARELNGHFSDGSPAHLVHVDAYRIGGVMRLPGDDVRDALLDELESLGLDEELDDPSEGTIVLMEWGEHMAGILADERCDVHVMRSEGTDDLPVDSLNSVDSSLPSQSSGSSQSFDDDEEPLSADGVRELIIVPRGASWTRRRDEIVDAFKKANLRVSVEHTPDQFEQLQHVDGKEDANE